MSQGAWLGRGLMSHQYHVSAVEEDAIKEYNISHIVHVRSKVMGAIECAFDCHSLSFSFAN